MPEMNKPKVNLPGHEWNPVGALANKLGKAGSGFGSRGAQLLDMAHKEKMQGIQNEHERTMQGAQHGHEKDLAIIGGAVDIEKEKIKGRSAIGVAREQGKAHVTATQIESDSRLKEQAATHRHEVKMSVLNHNQGLEKAAVDHHNAVHAAAEASVNTMNETAQKQNHEIAMKSLEDTHAANASTRAVSFLEALHKHSAGGTEANLDHQGIKAKFTFAHPEAPAAPAPEPTPVAEEKKPSGPVHMGIPAIPPKKEAPTPSATEPAPAKGLLINHPVTGRTVRRDSLTAEELQAAEAKKAKKASKPAPSKPAGSVARDPKTGRAISLKKK